ncbi:hypothetical protein C7377_0013 [Balneicella halophila]|uniref:N-acetylglucosamine kinase-like BadF-type ATPase n=1 Tax=Balneicella halophila TaxID=1537566 RepID=A0A7L4UPN0_BALHA|nr:ATPase [Balneicella halophila]PVX51728.1 hypothetical protein C7377_0013 [Balneicella halophila]
MKLIADSGSTKTDWILTNQGKRVHKITTQGINPFYQNTEQVTAILENELLPELGNESPNNLFFYGAGCSFEDKKEILATAFKNVWGHELGLSLNSDLIAAARALFGDTEGIACILGTGSNSCHWDGSAIVTNVPPLGYILGDEGSGAVLGKLLIADLLKNQLPHELRNKFYAKYNVCYEDLMAEVYKKPFPNRSLASYTYFISENIHEESMYHLVQTAFTSFVKRNLSQYPKQLTVGFVGSIANAFEPVLVEVLTKQGFTVGKFIQSPIEALEDYHA